MPDYTLQSVFTDRVKAPLAVLVENADEVLRVSQTLKASPFANEEIRTITRDLIWYLHGQCRRQNYGVESLGFYTNTALYLRKIDHLSESVGAAVQKDRPELQLRAEGEVTHLRNAQQFSEEEDDEEAAAANARYYQQPAATQPLFDPNAYGVPTKLTAKYRYVSQRRKDTVRVQAYWSKEELKVIFPALSFSAALDRVKKFRTQERVILTEFPDVTYEEAHARYAARRGYERQSMTGTFGKRTAKRVNLQPGGSRDQ